MTDASGEMTTYHYVYENRVRLQETDAQAVVFYGSYVTYMDETSLAFFRAVGHPYEDIVGGEWETVVAHVDLDYHDSARFGDRLANGIRVERLGRASIEFDYRCERREDDTLLADGTLVLVAIDESGEPTRIPDGFREAVAAYQDVPPEGR